MLGLHPSIILAAGALLTYCLPGYWRRAAVVAAPLLAVAEMLSMAPGTTRAVALLGYSLSVLKADELSLAFGLAFSLIAFLGAVYSLHGRSPGEHSAALAYAAGSLGVVLAGDWITLFFFWEVMAVSSTLLIWQGRRTESLAAGFRYLIVHLVGGNLLFFGILLLAGQGDLSVEVLTERGGPAAWLILAGVAINAAMPPLHAWLTDAYPEATPLGSVFLSAFTTKVAVYVLVRVFPGQELLAWWGAVMALYGITLVILENNLRRLLSYHIISQVGYMVAAAGVGTGLGLDGATAHAINNVLYKSLLFMAVGAVIHATGKEKLTELGGLAKTMPGVAALYAVGALSISGVPPFNGFISKGMVLGAVEEHGLAVPEFLLTLTSVGTFFSLSLKLFYLAFFGEDRGLAPRKIPLNMYASMMVCAVLCVAIGLYPNLLYSRLPYPVHYEPFTLDHVVSTLELFLGTLVGFWLYLPRLVVHPTITLDADWLYRRPLAQTFQQLVMGLKQARDVIGRRGADWGRAASVGLTNPFWGPSQVARLVRPALEPPPLYDENRYRPPLGLAVLAGMAFFLLAVVLVLARSSP